MRLVLTRDTIPHEAVGALEQGAMPAWHRCGEGGETSEAYVYSDERTVTRMEVRGHQTCTTRELQALDCLCR